MNHGYGVASPGPLSPLLARLRHRMADRLIPEAHRAGRILDLGYGTWPAFLARARFGEKHGLDRRPPSGEVPEGIRLQQRELVGAPLPYPDGHFDVATLLAVVEHLKPADAVALIEEVRRVLRSGGLVIVSLPSAHGDHILHWLGRLGLTSREQHDEHEARYNRATLRDLLVRAGFEEAVVEVGSFELGLNLWARATR